MAGLAWYVFLIAINFSTLFQNAITFFASLFIFAGTGGVITNLMTSTKIAVLSMVLYSVIAVLLRLILLQPKKARAYEYENHPTLRIPKIRHHIVLPSSQTLRDPSSSSDDSDSRGGSFGAAALAVILTSM